MVKKSIRFIIVFLFLFLFFWFANNGFGTESVGPTIVALILAIFVFLIVFKKLSNRLLLGIIIAFFLLSTAFEILEMFQFSNLSASLGFGIFLIFVIWNFVQSLKK